MITTRKEGSIMYNVFKQTDDGAFAFVAFRNDQVACLELIRTLEAAWPGIYVVRDPRGKDVAAGVSFGTDLVGAHVGLVRGQQEKEPIAR
jgi:hypothetical protein